MSEKSSKDLVKKIALLEQQLAAVTAERNLLHEQLGQAQEANLAAERRSAAAVTELRIVREQNLATDGKVEINDELPSSQPEVTPAPIPEQPPSPEPTPQPQPPSDPEVQPQSPPDIAVKDEAIAVSSTPPDTETEQDQSRIAKIWRWLWEENDRGDQSG